MAHSSNTPVVSGVAYEVSSVNDLRPENLDSFVTQPTVTISVVSDQQSLDISGCARRDGDHVVLYEKDHDGIGKDVRTWRISATDGRFEAAVRSMF